MTSRAKILLGRVAALLVAFSAAMIGIELARRSPSDVPAASVSKPAEDDNAKALSRAMTFTQPKTLPPATAPADPKAPTP